MHSLSPAQRATLEALCRRIAPPAATGADAGHALAALVEERLLAGDPHLRRDVGRLLALVRHPLITLLTVGRPVAFERCDAALQDRWLERWGASPFGLPRTVFQALRRLVLTTWYAQPRALAAIGDRGPLHERAPALPWEGALPGEPSDADPVARGPRLDRPPARPAPPRGLLTGDTLGAETRLTAGVCVIGSGAGGAVAAARLAEAGHDVVLLEEGGWWTPADFTEREAEMVPRLYADAGQRATDDLGLVMLQGRAMGGGTLVNWMLMLRTPDHVLEEWAREHGAEGMSPAAMTSVFDLVESEAHARLVPADAHSAQNAALLAGARRLGWRARAARVNAHDCVRAGTCGLGCRWDAKRSANVVYLPRALAAGARLLADVRAVRVELAERDGRRGGARGGTAPRKRVHAEVLDRTTGAVRGRVTVEAPIVVVAGGAVGTPALLQRSGLGGGGVGKFLRVHPTSAVVGRYGAEMYGAAGIPLSSVCDEFVQGDGDGYGFWVETAPLYPAVASVATPGFGAAHAAMMADFPRLASLIVLVRDGGDRARSNGDVRVARDGRPRIRYALGPAERRQLAAGIAAGARIHLAAGAEEAVTLHHRPARVRTDADVAGIATLPLGANQVGLFTAHVNGTCRIGRDPGTSGCAPDGGRHGVRGLYVADGSLLPTAPGVNPQETIMGVATVVAAGIADRYRAG